MDHGISIKRNKEYFEYEYQNKKHRYYPDFIVEDTIVEVKGYLNGAWPYKEQALKESKKKYIVLNRNNMKHIFEYIEKTYNKIVDKNIHELYE